MIQIAICDDEQTVVDKIHSELEAITQLKNIQYHIDTFLSGGELLASENEYQLVLLDISMEGKNGIQTGAELRSRYRQIQIIYITNFGEYITQAVNQVHAFSYLEKPITRQNLEPQIVEVLKLIEQMQEKESRPEVRFDIFIQPQSSNIQTAIQKFYVEDIYYFEYINRRIRIQLDQEDYYFKGQMMNLEKEMASFDFVLCHQSYLVNLAQVRSVKGSEILLQNGMVIPLAQRKSAAFRAELNAYMQRKM